MLSKMAMLGQDLKKSRIVNCEITDDDNLTIANYDRYATNLQYLWKTLTIDEFKELTLCKYINGITLRKGYKYYDYLIL